MKIQMWLASVAVLCGAAQASAVTKDLSWTHDKSVQEIAFEDCEPGCACCDTCCDCGDACDCGSCVCGRGGLLGAFEGLTLAGMLGTGSPIEIGGWSAIAYYDNNIPLSQATNDLLSFDDLDDRCNLSQQWFYVGKTTDGSDGLDIGGRFDVVYGTDAQKTQAFGNPGAGVRNQGTWDASWDHSSYGWAIPQCYGEVAFGNFSTKVGHFFTPIGYEVVPATGNFFHSHSYTMFNSEPFTHTGVLTTYTGFEILTLYGGWSLGWDTGFDQFNQGNCFLGGFGINIADAVTFTYLNTYGNFGWRDGGDEGNPSYEHSCVLTAQLTDRFQYVAQSDMIRTDNPGISTYDTIGLNQYLIFSMSDLIGIGARAEWWKAEGVSFYEATCGVNVHILSNLVFRPEYRQDWAPGINLDEDTVAMDAILTY